MLKCILVDDSKSILLMLTKFVEKTNFLELVATFTDPTEAYDYLLSNQIDLLILDIEMPEMTGIELLKALNNPPPTILITSKKEFAIEAYELEVKDYIIKPPTYPRFLKAVSKVRNAMESKGEHLKDPEEGIFVKVDQKMIKVKPNEIMYIESLSDYILLHTTTQRQYMVYSSMKAFLQKLKDLDLKDFIRIHRSYIINLKHITSFTSELVDIANKQLPIGNTYKEDFQKSVTKL